MKNKNNKNNKDNEDPKYFVFYDPDLEEMGYAADPSINLTKIGGTDQTGRDWSQDIEKLQNIDTQLSTRASESTLLAIKSKTDNIDTALSSRASEETLSAIRKLKTKTPPYWKNCSQFIERWEWLYNASETEKKREFYRKYIGRTGSIWKSEYAELDIDNWSLPLVITNNNTLQPHPWNNAIHLRNSKDGSTVDELYIQPKISMKIPVMMSLDAYFPAFNTTNWPANTGVIMGFEVNSGGQRGDIFALSIHSNGTTVTVEIYNASMIDGSLGGGGLSVSLPTDQWIGLKFVLTQTYFELFYTTTGGAPLTSCGRLYHAASFLARVTPFIANEGGAIMTGVKIGQMLVFEADGYKERRKIIDVTSISPGGSAEADGLKLTKECAITCRVTYGSTATKGVRVYILAKHDAYPAADTDSENTIDAFAYFEPSFAAGQTIQRTVNLDCLPKYCKIVVRNLDTSVATGAVKVYLHEVF